MYATTTRVVHTPQGPVKQEVCNPPGYVPSYLTRPQPQICTIYFIGPADGPIKIGFASRLSFRIRDLRLANAFPLEVWAAIEDHPSVERAYHHRFATHRLHGEWFARHPDILAEIDRLNTTTLSGHVQS
jgi:hypothetical protein